MTGRTPDAQCLGEQHWELALLPFGPGELKPYQIDAWLVQ